MFRRPVVIFFSGPIGAGKTTLGSAVAKALGGHFVEGDAHAPADKPWYTSALSTSKSILNEITVNASDHQPVVVAYPLGCISWIFYRRRLALANIGMLVVSLQASFTSITNPNRGRAFSHHERLRIRDMIEQGYGQREFSDLIVKTDAASFDDTLLGIIKELSHWLR